MTMNEPPTQVAAVARDLIAAHDRYTLSPLRDRLLKATPDKLADLWLWIDAALDQRLRLMDLRDGRMVSKAA